MITGGNLDDLKKFFEENPGLDVNTKNPDNDGKTVLMEALESTY